jgi:putative SOS response-associated peptidase YedK
MKKGRVDRYLVSGPPYLDPDRFAQWLDPNEDRAQALKALLVPLPDDWLMAHPVTKLVNNPRNEGPQCIERVT